MNTTLWHTLYKNLYLIGRVVFIISRMYYKLKNFVEYFNNAKNECSLLETTVISIILFCSCSETFGNYSKWGFSDYISFILPFVKSEYEHVSDSDEVPEFIIETGSSGEGYEESHEYDQDKDFIPVLSSKKRSKIEYEWN